MAEWSTPSLRAAELGVRAKEQDKVERRKGPVLIQVSSCGNAGAQTAILREQSRPAERDAVEKPLAVRTSRNVAVQMQS